MSTTNNSNRPFAGSHIGAVSTTKEIGLLYAHKKMKVTKVDIVDISAVAASETNYVTMTILKNGVDSGIAGVDTQAGLDAREKLEIPLTSLENGGMYLEAGDFLSILLTVAASGALTNVSAHADVEIIGN